MNDVYCSTKFTDLQVHIQSRLVYNCCKAYPERVNLDWLEQNPGKLFHTPTMTQDRTEMLAGKKCKSCDWGCYQYEAQGLTSARVRSTPIKIDNIYHPLKKLQISLSTDCNLTCAYCSSEWSTSWHQDIKKNGEYDVDGYKNDADNWSTLWNKMKQKNRSIDSRFFQLLLNEIKLTPSIEDISLLGGEPLLHNSLTELLETIKDKKITIVSGLGVNKIKLIKILNKVKDYNIQFNISAETTGPLFEFIRYGSKWKDFQDKMSLIKEAGCKIQFISTITNLTSFGLLEFYEMFADEHTVGYNSVTDRPFLQPNVLDDTSKKQLLDSIKDRLNIPFFKQLHDSTNQPYTNQQQQGLKKFLVEFARRRNLSLDIFPKHFLDWLEII
jgi:hypothetical protein